MKHLRRGGTTEAFGWWVTLCDNSLLRKKRFADLPEVDCPDCLTAVGGVRAPHPTANEQRLYGALKRCVPFVEGHVALTSILDRATDSDPDRTALDEAERLLHELRDPDDDLCGRCGHERGQHLPAHKNACFVQVVDNVILGPPDMQVKRFCRCQGWTV